MPKLEFFWKKTSDPLTIVEFSADHFEYWMDLNGENRFFSWCHLESTMVWYGPIWWTWPKNCNRPNINFWQFWIIKKSTRRAERCQLYSDKFKFMENEFVILKFETPWSSSLVLVVVVVGRLECVWGVQTASAQLSAAQRSPIMF